MTQSFSPSAPSGARRVLLFGASGAIGRATAPTLAARGHRVTCLLRPRATPPTPREGVEIRRGDVTDFESLRATAFDGARYDAVVSCLASRSGDPTEAWAVDNEAHANILSLAQENDVDRFVLLSAICVQKPRLAFQYAKLAFERTLAASGLDYVIVRPTAYFKSLSGQASRVRAGKPYLLFGDGRATACKPISDRDLADFLARALEDDALSNQTLPIGGPGPAITPREQGERLFSLLNRPARFRHLPPGAFRVAAGLLGAVGRVSRRSARAAEFARIAHYYATESMLVWDAARGRYDAHATPETGSDTLAEHYATLLREKRDAELGAHAMFDAPATR